jgi:hypothetical protein
MFCVVLFLCASRAKKFLLELEGTMKAMGMIWLCVGVCGLGEIAFGDGGSCKDTIVVFNDDNPVAPVDRQAPKVTMVLDCMASSANLPEQTTLNYFTYSSGKFCQSSRVCGNVKAWRGQFKIGTRIYWGQPILPYNYGTSYYGSNSGCDSYNDKDSDSNTDNKGYVYPGYWWTSPQYCDSGRNQVYGEFKIGREIIDRDCSAVEAWQCLDIPQPSGGGSPGNPVTPQSPQTPVAPQTPVTPQTR